MTSLSFSTDFDGVGNGAGFTINMPDSSSGPRLSSSYEGGDNSDSSTSVQQFYIRRYAEQLREARELAEKEELRKRIQKAKLDKVTNLQSLLEQLQQLENNEPNFSQRMVYTQKVLDIEKQFRQARTDYMATLPSYRDRMAWSMDHIVVPPPYRAPTHYQHILILGMGETPNDVAGKTWQDPFHEKPGEAFDKIFAFGKDSCLESARVVLDHIGQRSNQLSVFTTAQLEQLKGLTADEVVCHSNGCSVTKVLIELGMLKVSRLRILGGDNVLMNINNLETLIKEKHLEEISVYALRGDIVPLIEPGWIISDLMMKIGHPLQSFQDMAADATYQVLGLSEKPKYDPEAKLKVHILSNPAVSNMNFKENHVYENYYRVIKGLRMSGCLTKEGAMDRRCIFY